ncbi:MAG: FAD-dependent oxidoreductase [Erythrobacter sp.]|uniref:FAD-dependent oxidoreductase n=1 Tax=Erythrobacter sp. TaxID=1042 RepID=UPI00261BE725|nr:FAD-dependent oxidoreductase [Erythrobacter sp.]MDJ0978665.1 FAD-dependent oxidoreductase [Erythrobacter sp.]
MPGPIEIIMAIGKKLGYPIAAPQHTMLDMIERAEDHPGIGSDPLPAHPDSLPSTPFTNHIPFDQTALAHIGWRRLFSLITKMPRLPREMKRGSRLFEETFQPSRRTLSEEEREGLIAFMKERGALDIGFYPEVDPKLVFKGMALPERHAIVFTVEMEQAAMETAPSGRAFTEVVDGYCALGKIANETSEWLRERGIAAYPGTAMGGQTDYPAMAEAAGIGAIGYHGLLIGPNAGARMRVSTIYVGIDNLPKAENPHLWVRDVCANCRRCVRSCPPGAIEASPKPKANGFKRSIRATACRDYFGRNWGCAICVKVCPFSEKGYDVVRKSYEAGLANPVRTRPTSTIAETATANATIEGPRIAVVGAGPAGFYVAKSVLERDPTARIDMIERLPFPHGLVRYGVAPDHPEVRAKGFTYDRMLEHPRIRFLGGVEIGKDVEASELRGLYDAVCLSTGAPANRRLGIPGEDLPGSFAAPDLVRWYNAHPDFYDLDPRIGKRVAIIGHGNVALDTARMLVSDPHKLILTDMMPEAAARFASSDIEEVEMIGRSGPSQTSFTPKELVELSDMPGVQIIVDPADLEADLPLALADPQAERRRKRNLELFAQWAAAPCDQSKRPIRIRFRRNPSRIEGSARVEALILDGTRVVEKDGRAQHEMTGESERLECGSVIRAIGFRTTEIAGLPFDTERARMSMDAKGRVLNADGAAEPFLYASGWARRGPIGVIGTNKVDAEEVAATMLTDLADATERRGAPGLDIEAPVDLNAWFDIQREEKRRGAVRGMGALRFVDPSEAIDWLSSHGRRRLNDPTLPPVHPEMGRVDRSRVRP